MNEAEVTFADVAQAGKAVLALIVANADEHGPRVDRERGYREFIFAEHSGHVR